MVEISEKEAKLIEGGSAVGILLALAGLGIFIIGFLDGLTEKLPCKAK